MTLWCILSEVCDGVGLELGVEEIVLQAFGRRPEQVEPLPSGQSGNRVFAVKLSGGMSAVVRISSGPRTFAHTPGNIETLHRLGIPVPTVLSRGPTRGGGSFIVLSWVPGRDLVFELESMSRLQITQLAETIAGIGRRVLELPPAEGFGPAPIGFDGPLTTWTDLFGPAGGERVDRDKSTLGMLRRRLRQVRAGLESYFSEVAPRCFLDDLTLKNALIHKGTLSGIIDIDMACYGDPLLTVGATLAELARGCNEEAQFYGQELVRCWKPDDRQQRAIWFYATLFACGFLSLKDVGGPGGEDRLVQAADGWLTFAEQADACGRAVHGSVQKFVRQTRQHPVCSGESGVRRALDGEGPYGARRSIAPTPRQVQLLKPLIKQVEYYQPLYGLDIAPKPLRPCVDRARAVEKELNRLPRPVRLIDLGSSLGYFVFYFADRGMTAEGVDFLPQNVAVAEMIAQINGISCRFQCREMTLESVREMAPGRYDTALLFSILHHIIHARGLGYAQALVRELLDRVPLLIVEFAHGGESVDFAWRGSQPADPLDVLRECGAIQMNKIGEFPTHLSSAMRPLWAITRASGKTDSAA